MGKSVFHVILSFGLMVDFLGKVIEISNKIYPNTGFLTVGGSQLPWTLRWLNPLNDFLNSKAMLWVMLVVTFFAFLYAVRELIGKVRNRNLA